MFIQDKGKGYHKYTVGGIQVTPLEQLLSFNVYIKSIGRGKIFSQLLLSVVNPIIMLIYGYFIST